MDECSACCEHADGFVFLSKEEALTAARYLEMDGDEFLLHFTRKFDRRYVLTNGENDHCVFLENGQCLIYPVRPLQCRAYPFWPENLTSRESWERTKQECPGIGHGRLITNEEILSILKENS